MTAHIEILVQVVAPRAQLIYQQAVKPAQLVVVVAAALLEGLLEVAEVGQHAQLMCQLAKAAAPLKQAAVVANLNPTMTARLSLFSFSLFLTPLRRTGDIFS
jgi:hypothetical protein